MCGCAAPGPGAPGAVLLAAACPSLPLALASIVPSVRRVKFAAMGYPAVCEHARARGAGRRAKQAQHHGGGRGLHGRRVIRRHTRQGMCAARARVCARAKVPTCVPLRGRAVARGGAGTDGRGGSGQDRWLRLYPGAEEIDHHGVRQRPVPVLVVHIAVRPQRRFFDEVEVVLDRQVQGVLRLHPL